MQMRMNIQKYKYEKEYSRYLRTQFLRWIGKTAQWIDMFVTDILIIFFKSLRRSWAQK